MNRHSGFIFLKKEIVRYAIEVLLLDDVLDEADVGWLCRGTQGEQSLVQPFI
jgi:hypothetical protein